MDESINQLELPGLNGSDPLAFLATLGLLRAASSVRPNALLSWTPTLIPVIGSWRDGEQNELASAACDLIKRVCTILSETAYPSQIPALNIDKFRSFSESACASHDALHFDLAAALACEGCPYLWIPSPRQKKQGVEQEIRASGTRLCNADNPGGKRLIGMFRQFPSISAEFASGEPGSFTLRDFVREVMGSWKYHSPELYKGKPKFPAFRWDPLENRPAAFESASPDGDNLPSIPGANALAVLGLTFFPTMASPKVATACISRQQDEEHFVWPLWKSPISPDVLRSLLHQRDRWVALSQRDALGVFAVFGCQRHTDDNGSHFFLGSTAR